MLTVRLGLTYIFIAHCLIVVEYISDCIMVIYLDKIVDSAETDKIFNRPVHPYTEALLNAILRRSASGHHERTILYGEVPSPVNPLSGCVFHPRCKYVQEVCKAEIPQLGPYEEDPHTAIACHRANELDLRPFT